MGNAAPAAASDDRNHAGGANRPNTNQETRIEYLHDLESSRSSDSRESIVIPRELSAPRARLGGPMTKPRV